MDAEACQAESETGLQSWGVSVHEARVVGMVWVTGSVQTQSEGISAGDGQQPSGHQREMGRAADEQRDRTRVW